MAQRRISISDVTVGTPLPWDVFDSKGILLLHQGYVVNDQRQVEVLIERGLYVDFGDPANMRRPAPQILPRKEKPSVLRLINEANKRLEYVLLNLTNEANAEAKILEIAKVVDFAVRLNSDVALACILLNQISGMYAVRHCTDTAIVSILVARTMQKSSDEIMSIIAAALTMNIGMLTYHDKLQKKEGVLTEEEFATMRRHPQDGVEVLQQAGIKDHDWLSYVLHHHENEDGSGYPKGLSGQDIPQNSKIIALADRYCARVSARSYKKSLFPNTALRDIFIDQGKSVDPLLAAYFIKELGLYPPGTFVRLQNREIGVVVRKGAAPTTPVVHAIIGPGGGLLASSSKRDTGSDMYAIQEVLHEKKLTMRFEMHQLWGEEANP